MNCGKRMWIHCLKGITVRAVKVMLKSTGSFTVVLLTERVTLVSTLKILDISKVRNVGILVGIDEGCVDGCVLGVILGCLDGFIDG